MNLSNDQADKMAATHRAMLAASPAYFAAHTLTGPREPPYNGRFIIGKHHLEWDKLALSDKKVCVLASRNLGKSYYWSMALPLFFATYQPGAITFILGSTQDTAQMIMARIVAQLEYNEKLAHLLPGKGVTKKWNTSLIRLANGHEIHCAGMGTKKRGFHPDNIIGDDLLSDEDAYSETIRQRTINYFMSAVTPMLSPGGRMAVVGTPQSARDLLVGNLRTNPAYHYVVFPGEVDGEPMWAERLSREWLDDRKAEIGNVRYAREILCQPVADTSSLFPLALFQGEPTEQYGVSLGMPREHWAASGMTIYQACDLAMSQEVGSDYTVIITIGIDAHQNVWIIDIQRVRGMPFEQQKALIAQMGHKYQPTAIVIESNQAQRFMADELIRTTNLPVVRFTTTAAKHSLEHGLPSMKLMFENRKLRLPRGDASSVEMTDILTDEFNNFTFLGGKAVSVGEHDDVAMALWIALQGPKMSAFSVSFGSEVMLQAGSPVPQTAQDAAHQQLQAQFGQVRPTVPGLQPHQMAPAFDPFGFGQR